MVFERTFITSNNNLLIPDYATRCSKGYEYGGENDFADYFVCCVNIWLPHLWKDN